MTKEEALKALDHGKKLTHRWFSPDEWVMNDCGMYVFEDGCKCDSAAFWHDRTDESWKTGWSIFNS